MWRQPRIQSISGQKDDRRASPRLRGGPWRRARQYSAGPRLPLTEVEDLLQIGLDVLLITVLGDGQLLDKQRTRGVEHLSLAERKILVGAQQVEIPQNLSDLEHRAGLDLVHVLA